MKEETDIAKLRVLTDRWLKKTPPNKAEENDALIKLVESYTEMGKKYWVYIKVTWNVLRDRYEAEVMNKDDMGAFTISYAMLSPDGYVELHKLAARVGIHKIHRAHDVTKPKVKPSVLEEYLAPQTIQK